MTAVSLSLSHGSEGFKNTDFTVGTSAPGTGDIELRYNLTDTNSNNITRKDVILAAQAFIRALESGSLYVPGGP